MALPSVAGTLNRLPANPPGQPTPPTTPPTHPANPPRQPTLFDADTRDAPGLVKPKELFLKAFDQLEGMDRLGDQFEFETLILTAL